MEEVESPSANTDGSTTTARRLAVLVAGCYIGYKTETQARAQRAAAFNRRVDSQVSTQWAGALPGGGGL